MKQAFLFAILVPLIAGATLVVTAPLVFNSAQLDVVGQLAGAALLLFGVPLGFGYGLLRSAQQKINAGFSDVELLQGIGFAIIDYSVCIGAWLILMGLPFLVRLGA